jgi:PAS domain S-box-containing protein
MPGTSTVRANAEQIADDCACAAGARVCYLAIAGVAGHRPRLIVSSDTTDLVPWDPAEVAALLRRARGRSSLSLVDIGGWPALVLPLVAGERSNGLALLIFAPGTTLDQERAQAAVSLAARTLDAVRQIGVLHLQAEEIEERAHLREIQVSRNLIRGVIDSIPMGLALIDSDGTVLAANRPLAERFDFDPAVLVGMAYGAAIGPWQDSPAARTFASRAPQRARRTITQADGRETLLEIASIPLLGADGQPRQVVEVWEDITERVALQTQLIRVEKLAAIGQLAASIAHEVGNPLQAIQGFLSLFLEQCDPKTPNRRFLELAEEEIERIVQVLARLRDLYRPRADVVELVDVHELLEHVLLLTNKQLERSRIRVLRELSPAAPQILAVADQIKQVLLNLVLNAIEAMHDGGLLHVQTFTRPADLSGAAIIISITDTGVGIPPDQLPRIFDGLHTSKERGMGLGLYTSKAIVDRHMGRLAVQSVPGEGTTFTITLPIRTEESPT